MTAQIQPIPAKWGAVVPLGRPIVARYVVRRPLLDLARRVRRSPFAADVRRGWDRSLAVLGGFAIAYAFLILVRGAWYAGVLLGAAR